MSTCIRVFDSAADLIEPELNLLREAVSKHGRVTLLVRNYAERELCRRALACAGLSLGIDVTTPDAWIDELWGVFGDGTGTVSNLRRQLLIDNVLAGHDARELAPLSDNPGTRRLLARVAQTLLPYVQALSGAQDGSRARLDALLGEYAEALTARGLVETSQEACLLCDAFAKQLPASATCVVARHIESFPAYLLDLLACVGRAGDLLLLLPVGMTAFARTLQSAFELRGVQISGEHGSHGATAPRRVPQTFLEVAGPHARARAYTEQVEKLVSQADAGKTIAVVAPRYAEAFDTLAPYLAARGIRACRTGVVGFAQSEVGRQFAAISSVVERMKAAQAGSVGNAEWWPAPELSDWLYSPLSGVPSFDARRFDKKIRGKRELSVDDVLSELQRVQTKVARERKELSEDDAWAGVPVVCSDVVQYIWRERPVSAFKAMLSVVQAAPATAWGAVRGQVAPLAESALAQRAIDMLMDTARELDVSQRVAVLALDELRVMQPVTTEIAHHTEVNERGGAQVCFFSLQEAASVSADSFAAALFIDMGTAEYPLTSEEGLAVSLAEQLSASSVEAEPAASQRVAFESALRAVSGSSVFARVTHDRQAKESYPAAIWTELLAQANNESCVLTVGEDNIMCDFDVAGGSGMEQERVSCLPPQQLSDKALPYLVLRRRASGTEDAPLVPRQFSASQIESYSSCPLCWFMSSRVRPTSLDAGFGNMEMGNFVHDVLYRLHNQLREEGLRRVTPQNLERSIEMLHEVFSEVRTEHARGKTSSSAPLVPLNHEEELQVDAILPQLERVLRYEALALAPFAPTYLEYSFNGAGITYAGVPFGGRIDRVDVDAEGRAVVIDYKHRGDVNPFRLKASDVVANDERWLPAHTQTLIYAQAVRRALGLDTRGALYFSTKGKHPAMRGAVSTELAEEVKNDGHVPGLKDGFPGKDPEDSTTFDELLDLTEAHIETRLHELEAGCVAASDDATARHEYNHPLGFERRGA